MEQKRTRRTFDPLFKLQAAKRVVEDKEKAAAVAADLGINIVSLYSWIKDFEKLKAEAISNYQANKAPENETAVSPEPTASEPSVKAPETGAPRRPKLQLKKNRPPVTQETEPTGFTQVETRTTPETAPKEIRQNSFEFHAAESVAPAQSAETEKPISSVSQDDNRRELNNQRDQNGRRFNPYLRQQRTPQKNNQNAQPANKPQGQKQEFSRNNQTPRPEGQSFQQNRNPQQVQPSYEVEEELSFEAPTEQAEVEESRWPVPSAAQGRSWKVMHALEQRPNYKEESAHYGYVDEFSLPAETLPEVWGILDVMQKKIDKRAFEEMVHEKELNVPPEVLADPRATFVSGPNIPNKPWLRKPRLNPIADDFFQTTPDYAKSVYETYGGITLRLAKNSQGSPILLVVPSPQGGKDVTIDFSKFDRFVDDFYGDFVRDCKTVMMKQNPKEYPSLNAFIRIPDEPMWNPKLWAGIRTFNWKDGESLSEAWIRYARDQRRNNRNQRHFYRSDRE